MSDISIDKIQVSPKKPEKKRVEEVILDDQEYSGIPRIFNERYNRKHLLPKVN